MVQLKDTRLAYIGSNQVEGEDFTETFAPVKTVTVRCLLTIAASQGWELYQMDVHKRSYMGTCMKKFI